MTIEPIKDFPSVSDVQKKIGDQQEPGKPRRSLRSVLLILFGFVLLLGAILFLRSNQFNFLIEKGAVTGVLVDETGQPIAGEVTVEHTETLVTTDASGRFILNGLRAGNQTLIVAYQYVGKEIPVFVSAGETLDLGQVQVVTIGDDFLVEE